MCVCLTWQKILPNKKNVGVLSQDGRGIDGETTFSPTNLSKDELNVEQLPQNNFWTLGEDTRHPERQPNLFKRRQDKI